MQAARLTAFGDPPTFELVEIADPAPGEGEVVVDIVAAALNRRDPWIWLTPDYCPLPVTLGSDGAGIVSAVGPGVEAVAAGDEVCIDPTLGWGDDEKCPTDAFDILGAPTEGTFAERVVVPAANVAPRPSRLSWEECAALNLSGLTAWRATVTCAEAGPGRDILVTGRGRRSGELRGPDRVGDGIAGVGDVLERPEARTRHLAWRRGRVLLPRRGLARWRAGSAGRTGLGRWSSGSGRPYVGSGAGRKERPDSDERRHSTGRRPLPSGGLLVGGRAPASRRLGIHPLPQG